MTKLWIDDERTPPDDGWVWMKSSDEALKFLKREWVAQNVLDEIAFDHDLGGTDDTRPVMDWLIEHDYWPKVISIHSGNPVGHRSLYRAALAHAPEGVDIIAKFK